MLGELGTKKKVLDQDNQKRIEEQKNYKMETISDTLTIEPSASQEQQKTRSFIHALRTYEQ